MDVPMGLAHDWIDRIVGYADELWPGDGGR